VVLRAPNLIDACQAVTGEKRIAVFLNVLKKQIAKDNRVNSEIFVFLAGFNRLSNLNLLP